jgi:hypothetical protein
MDDYGYLPLLLGLVLLPLVVVLPFLALSRIVRRLAGGSLADVAAAVGSGFTGGWRQLATRYASDRTPPAGLLRRQTVMVGVVVLKRVVSIGADAEGLYLALGGFPNLGRQPPLSIPWCDLIETGKDRLYWRETHVFAVGQPPLGVLKVLPEVHALMRPFLSTAPSGHQGDV